MPPRKPARNPKTSKQTTAGGPMPKTSGLSPAKQPGGSAIGIDPLTGYLAEYQPSKGKKPRPTGAKTPDQDPRALSLGVDELGGYAVPKQLDGTRPKKKRKGK